MPNQAESGEPSPAGKIKKLRSFLFENTTTRQTIAKNTLWLTVSQFGGRLIKAVLIIYAARVLGAAGYGLFSYAVTLAGFLGLLMDPGINAVLMRDSAKSDEHNRLVIFSTTLWIKISLLVIGALIVIFIAPSFSTLPGAKVLLPIVAFILVFDTTREFFLALLRGIEKMQWDAGIFIFTNLAIVIFGFLSLALHPTPRALGWGYALGTGLGALFAMIVMWKYLRDAFSLFSARLVSPILRAAWPFAVTNALGLLLTNMDILIISWMRSASDVGIYSAAIRIIQVLYLVPGILQLSTLPLISRLANHDNAKLRITLERTISILFLVAIPMTIGGVILGTGIMSLIFGPEFTPGSLAFKILMVTMLVDFPGAIIGNAIFAYGHQKSLIITTAIAGVSNVVFDLLLIPHFGMTGSAVATLIAQTLSNLYLWRVMQKLNYFKIFPYLKKVTAASLVMSIAAAVLLFLHVEVVLNIAICTVIYFGLLKAFREPLLDEILAIIPGGWRLMEKTQDA